MGWGEGWRNFITGETFGTSQPSTQAHQDTNIYWNIREHFLSPLHHHLNRVPINRQILFGEEYVGNPRSNKGDIYEDC